jgi:hypothetical protein
MMLPRKWTYCTSLINFVTRAMRGDAYANVAMVVSSTMYNLKVRSCDDFASAFHLLMFFCHRSRSTPMVIFSPESVRLIERVRLSICFLVVIEQAKNGSLTVWTREGSTKSKSGGATDTRIQA